MKNDYHEKMIKCVKCGAMIDATELVRTETPCCPQCPVCGNPIKDDLYRLSLSNW